MHYPKSLVWLLLLIGAVSHGGDKQQYSQQDLNNEMVVAANWMQHSPEYRALVYQSFNIATDQLAEKLTRLNKKEKPAIIIDIDETLLNGTVFHSSLIGTNEKLTVKRSLQWWHRPAEKSEPLPGAIDFVNQAASKGVEIFYISGRYDDALKPTIQALNYHGFPFADADHIQLQPASDRTLSKAAKREQIKNKGYTIIMLMGDQLDDLAEIAGPLHNQRQQWADKQAHHFGRQWIIFPNPLYGSWESSLSANYSSLSPIEKHNLRLEKLNCSLSNEQDPQFKQHLIQAAIWQLHSGSYRALSHQAYNQAVKQLKKIKHTNKNQPLPAIVVDIDGTVLNTFANINTVNLKNNEKNRNKVLLDTKLPCIPGARNFLKKAHKMGYEIFYITNRSITFSNIKEGKDIEATTLANLKYHQLPDANAEHLLLREKFCSFPHTNCPKELRRKAIEDGKVNGKKYKIALFIGDLLGDFDLTEQKLDPYKQETVDAVKTHFGQRYILLPNLLNPPYLRKVYSQAASKNFNEMSIDELAEVRLQLLKDWLEKPLPPPTQASP